MRFKDYYTVAKPGIVYGNLFVAVGAFFVGAQGHFDLQHFAGMLLGLGLVIASGSVFNNYFDRDIDAAMDRTRTRASVTGAIAPRTLLIYAAVLGIVGAFVLYVLVNKEALIASLFGLIAYDLFYTLLAKRGSEWGTVIGSISGAIPPVVGYVAATGSFDLAALVVFLMLVFWQMPHAYAIALYRFDDYKAAGIPVLPVSRGILRTKVEILLYVIAFTLTAVHLTRLGATGQVYGFVAVVSSLVWLGFAIRGFYITDWKKWGRTMFRLSLIVLMLLFFVMALDGSGLF